MAIYWMDPWATSNGNGTYASPYWPGTTSGPTLATGDEWRIKSRYITDIVEPTTETGYWDGNNFRIRIPNSSVAYSQWDIIYFPQFGTFAKITNALADATVPTETDLTVANNNPFPVPVTDFTTPITIQRVATANIPAFTSNNIYMLPRNGTYNRNNSSFTATDGWVDETTRVTDGTAVSLFNTTSTASAFYINLGYEQSWTSTAAPTYDIDTVNADFRNSVFVIQNSTSSSTYNQMYFRLNGTFRIKQYPAGGVSYSSGGAFTQNVGQSPNISVQIDHYQTRAGRLYFQTSSFSSSHGDYKDSLSISCINAYTYTPVFGKEGSTAYQNNGVHLYDYTVSYGTNYCYTMTSGTTVAGLIEFSNFGNLNMTLGPVYILRDYTAVSGGLKTINLTLITVLESANITFSNDFTVVDSEGNILAFDYTSFYTSGYPYSSGFGAPTLKLHIPTLPGAMSPTVGVFGFGQYQSGASIRLLSSGQPSSDMRLLVVPTNFNSSIYEQNTVRNLAGLAMKFNDNIVYPTYIREFPSTSNPTSLPIVNRPYLSLDSAIYKTTGPSIKMKLATYSNRYTGSGGIHPIRFNVESGTTYTISGSFRTDRTAIATGDSKILYFQPGSNTSTAGVSMTNAALNAWEDFSFTYSATATGTAVLHWDCFFNASNQNYWLDNLEIS